MLYRRTIIPMAMLLVAVACAEDTAEEQLDETLAEQIEPAEERGATGGDATAALAMLSVDSTTAAEPFLTDAQGRALYLIEGEPEGQSTCRDECAQEWPPLLLQGGTDAATGSTAASDTAAGDALQPDMVGTLQREDGSTQVTYGGHALYRYHDDQAAGQISGQDVTDQWGEWYLVGLDGEPLEDVQANAGGE